MSTLLLEYQRLVEDIRAALTGGNGMGELASPYSIACQTANERLRKCQQLLAQGLRGEALQLAEAEPHLLDVAGVLDFPEAAIWRDRVAAIGLAPPPALLIEAAAAINEAYALDQPLTALLAKHRIQALSRAPLARRISTLRKIAELDGQNPIWQQDLAEYERTRFRQIQSEAEAALKSKDADTLHRLNEELADTAWRSPPPKGLVQRIGEYRGHAQRRSATAQLEQCATQLYDAYAAMDFDAARALGQQWEWLWPDVDPGQADELLERAGPALQWLADFRAVEQSKADRDRAEAELSAALDTDTARIELDRLYHQLAKHQQEIPVRLEQRYRQRMRDLDLRATRRTRVLATIAVLLLVTLSAGTWWVVSSRRFANTRIERTAALRAHLDAGQWLEADTYIADTKSHHPAVAAHGDFAALVSQLKRAKSDEAQRKQSFEVAIAAAEQAGAETPDLAAVRQSEQLAKLDEERLRIATLKRQIAEAAKQRQMAIDEKFRSGLKPLLDRFTSMKSKPAASREDRKRQANRLREEVNGLLATAQGVSEPVRQGATTLLTGVRTLQKEDDDAERQEALVVQLAEAVGSVDRFAGLLDLHAQEFPSVPRAKAFQAVRASRLPLLAAVEQWNTAAGRWRSTSLSKMGPPRAKAILAERDKLPASTVELCIDPTMEPAFAYLASIGQRVDDEGNSILKTLRSSYLENRFVLGLYYVLLKNGDRYYSDVQIEKPNGPLQARKVSCIVDFEGKKEDIRFEFDQYETSGEAPHSLLATRFLKRLTGPVNESWEPSMIQMLADIQEAKNADEIFRFLLLQEVLEAAAKGSSVWAAQFDNELRTVKESTVKTDVAWLDPRDSDAKDQRRLAKQLLTRMDDLVPSLKAEGEAVIASLDELDQDWARLAWRWVGVALSDDQGRMFARGLKAAEPPARLYHLVMVEGAAPRFEPVTATGTATGTDHQLTGAELLDGEPLFTRGESLD